MKKLKNRRYNGHDVHTVNGYPAICANGKCTVYVHRLVAEEVLNRKLKPEEVVHHEDGDRSNYDTENISIFKTKSDHSGYHKCGAAILTDDGTYICNDIAKRLVEKMTNECPKCGNPKDHKAKMCKECYTHYLDTYIQGTDRPKPTEDELRELLKTNSKEKIGRMYGVSGKSVAKWVDKYGLK